MRKKIFPPTKGKQTSTCLEIRFCDFRCSAVEVSRLNMASNEFDSLRKTFDIKIMTFPPALETLGRYCMKEKLIKSRDPWKSKRFQITRDIVAFSILLRTRTVHLEVSVIIYSTLSTPPYFLLYVLW